MLVILKIEQENSLLTHHQSGQLLDQAPAIFGLLSFPQVIRYIFGSHSEVGTLQGEQQGGNSDSGRALARSFPYRIQHELIFHENIRTKSFQMVWMHLKLNKHKFLKQEFVCKQKIP